MRGILAAVFATLVIACACGGDSLSVGTRTPTQPPVATLEPAFAELASRALDLPSTSGGECPVTEAQLLSPTQPFTIGDGPVLTSGVGSASVLKLSERGDWLVGNLQWTAPRDFDQKALIRGGRIDDDGDMGFGLTRPQLAAPDRIAVELDPELELPRGDDVDFAWSADVFVTTEGCYALQIDGEEFTETVVFSAEMRS